MMRSFLNKAVIGAIALTAISGTAFAQALNPGSALTPVQLGEISAAGLTLFATNSAAYTGTSGSETISGTLTSAVYGNAATVGASTSLTFLYQLVNNAGSTSSITDFRLNGFNSATVTNTFEDNTGFGAFAVPTGPRNVSLRRSAVTGGNTITYSYDPDSLGPFLLPSGASNILAVVVAGNAFDPTGNASVNGLNGVSANTSGTVYTSVPAVIVPEANAGMLAGLALPLLGGMAILRRKK